MTTKKSSKSAPKKAVVPETPPVPVKTPSVIRPVAVENPVMPVEKYLMSIGTRADHIASRAVWAKGHGLTIATVSQWKKLFESF